MKVVQYYVPTAGHTEENMEVFYEKLSAMLDINKPDCTLIIGDFNKKLGKRKENNEKYLGKFKVKLSRNKRKRRAIFEIYDHQKIIQYELIL